MEKSSGTGHRALQAGRQALALVSASQINSGQNVRSVRRQPCPLPHSPRKAHLGFPIPMPLTSFRMWLGEGVEEPALKESS